MAKIPMTPMTPTAKMAYAIKCQLMAERMKKIGDFSSMELNLWMANNYLQSAMTGDRK